MGESNIHTIQRRKAKSGVSYGDSVVLHETGATRVVFVPFFIPRSHGTELAIKIVSYKKNPPPTAWSVIEEKSISLQGPSACKLLNSLKEHLAVAQENEDGDYITIKVAEGTVQLGEHQTEDVAKALTKILAQPDIIKHLEDTEFSEELLSAFRGAIRLKEMRSAVTQLREHLHNQENDESVYQQWCQDHSWAFGNAYVMKDDVRKISTGDQLDLLLSTVISGYRDIVELKRPDMKVLPFDSTHNNFYFSSEVNKAIGQCHRYLDVFHEEASKGLRDHPEIISYHPRATIVIGRSVDWKQEQHKALHGLNRRLSGITIMTYDQLLAQGERLITMMSSEKIIEEGVENQGTPY